jgi:hypothetical protein
MKPRLANLPTEEDVEVLMSLARRQRFRVFGPVGMLAKLWDADRRDADRMWEWMRGSVYGLGGDLYVRTFPWVLAGTSE